MVTVDAQIIANWMVEKNESGEVEILLNLLREYFLSFNYIQAKQIINLPLNNFCPAGHCTYGSVTRYGPQVVKSEKMDSSLSSSFRKW